MSKQFIVEHFAFAVRRMLATTRIIFACGVLFNSAYSLSATNDPVFKPVVDARGFIDVWQLRSDVALVPDKVDEVDNDYYCYPDHDDGIQPSGKELERERKFIKACVEKSEQELLKYKRIFAAFNQAWLPVMMSAISKGDTVAEVILRQCDTTPAFDRSGIENTCAGDTTMAEFRLNQIGFSPALQNCNGYSNFPESPVVDYPRAFTFYRSTSGVWKTDSFACLSLHRQPQTPGFMTKGRELHYGGGNSIYDGLNFQQPSSVMLARQEAEINRYLKQDPRWAVFLLTRVGRHEWVPEGTKSNTHILDASWLGEWELEKETYDWRYITAGMVKNTGHAAISQNGEFTQITIQSVTHQPPFLDVENCTLRYSGGSTFNYYINNEEDATHTNLGYYGTGKINSETLAPLDPKKRYKQVLMQCANAEADDNSRMRFLLLAEDTLIEVGYEPMRGSGIAVRHFRRIK